ncbi:hypothetical protein WA026_010169 [Henosepilachna vigintioctopunctata]|uniref:Uncharacterized protein n=1 Tax=Henosepilachna vigintioctopunctata TaxID=420089 RepID=A0AAW1UJQ7_9CUCU
MLKYKNSITYSGNLKKLFEYVHSILSSEEYIPRFRHQDNLTCSNNYGNSETLADTSLFVSTEEPLNTEFPDIRRNSNDDRLEQVMVDAAIVKDK